MVKIRLRRVGAKKQPHYRVVVADSQSPRDGKFLETIGHYNPRTEPPTMEIDAERALYWLSVGAQPSEAVRRMLDKLGILAQAATIKHGEVVAEAEAEVEPVEAEADEAEAVEAEADEKEAEAVEAEAEEEEAEAVEAEAEEEEAEAVEAEVDEEEAEAVEAEAEEDPLEEEDDEFEEDLLDEDEELDETEDEWEPEIAVSEESDDLKDDWELDVKDDDDVDEDQPFEEEDE
jgi:small subunit ribosomal protein S16